MAGQISGDQSVDSANREKEQKHYDSASRRLEHDQAVSDRDQTLADSDQAASDSDQAASDSDQAGSDSDQAASFRDLAGGGELPAEHNFVRGLRDRRTEQRENTARERVDAAAARDAVAQARDATALERDQAADRRDRELAASADGTVAEGRARQRAARNRRSAAIDRAQCAEIRARAAEDRAQAARDREQAARDREQAQADREALLHQLAIAETDALTGARSRAAGLVDLDHEIDRARRTQTPLVAAYVDVVGLKAVNDTHGHGAGDALLQRTVRGIRDHLRPYDLIVRLGGDEFLCVMSGATLQEGRQRFATVQTTLAANPTHARSRLVSPRSRQRTAPLSSSNVPTQSYPPAPTDSRLRRPRRPLALTREALRETWPSRVRAVRPGSRRRTPFAAPRSGCVTTTHSRFSAGRRRT